MCIDNYQYLIVQLACRANVIHHDEATKIALIFVDINKDAHLRQELKCMPCLVHAEENQRVISDLLYVICVPMTIEILYKT